MRNAECGMRSPIHSAFRIPHSAFFLLLPTVVAAGLLAWYHLFLFGAVVPDAGLLEKGTQYVYYWPWQSVENLTHFVTTAYALLFDADWGLLIYAPVYLLAVVGMIAMFRSARRSAPRGYQRLLGW